MGRMIICPLTDTITASANQDIWSLMAGSGNKLILHGWEITSATTTATIIAMSLRRLTVVGSGGDGTAVEEQLNEDDTSTISGSVRTGDTNDGTESQTLAWFQWEQLGPLGQIYTPEMRPIIEPSGGIALNTADATGFTMSGWVCWEEI
jgi:hypothetical protein